METGIYFTIYELLQTYIYGVETAALTSDMSLVLTLLATAACIFCIALPFLPALWLVSCFFRW